MTRTLPPALLAALVLLLSGCESDYGTGGLAQRASDALVEVGASPSLMECLTYDLEDHLAKADAEAAYQDLASEPEISEIELNRISLLQKAVEERLVSRAGKCRGLLIRQGLYTQGEIDRMLHRVGNRGYREPDLFLER